MKNTRPMSKGPFAPKRAVTLEEARADGTSSLVLQRLSRKYSCHIGDDLRRVAAQLAASNDNNGVERRVAA